MKPLLVGIVLMGVALAACTSVLPGSSAGPTFVVTTTKPADSVTPVVSEDTVRFDVVSESGIGGAGVTLASGSWPPRILLRFHLTGLEELRFHYGETTILVAVPNTEEGQVRESVLEAEGGEQQLAPGSPQWMEVQVERSAASVVEYVEVAAPDAFRRGGYREFDMQWVDFYR